MYQGKTISLIAAVAENGIIGHNGKLPWHDPTDLQWFQDMTRNKACIFGTTTFNEVIFNLNANKCGREFYRWSREEGHDFFSLTKRAIKAGYDEIMICGGAQLYEYVMAKKIVDRFYISHIKGHHEGDTYFPLLRFGRYRP